MVKRGHGIRGVAPPVRFLSSAAFARRGCVLTLVDCNGVIDSCVIPSRASNPARFFAGAQDDTQNNPLLIQSLQSTSRMGGGRMSEKSPYWFPAKRYGWG